MQPMLHGTARAYATSEQARAFVARQWRGPEGSCCSEEPSDTCCCGTIQPSGSESTCCGGSDSSNADSGCSCCGEDTAQMQLDTSSLDEFLIKRHNNTFAVSGMLFQDACNLDLERLRRCYILETDSRYGMVPFCAYNMTSIKGKALYR